MAGTVILNGQDIGQARWATSAVLGVVLAEHGTTFDRWVVRARVRGSGASPSSRRPRASTDRDRVGRASRARREFYGRLTPSGCQRERQR